MTRAQLVETATHAELVAMAQMCAANARAMRGNWAVANLWKKALEYQEDAARLDGGRKPYIGPPPTSFSPKESFSRSIPYKGAPITADAVKRLTERFLAWWRSGLQDGRLNALDPAEVEHMAREFGLSADELSAVNRCGGRASELIRGMVRANGLSYEELRQSHPDVLRDLEIHCSLCVEKKRCRHDLVSGVAPEGFSDYCPNASTFVELQAEALQRLI
jgi:hypothetical protein